MSFTTEQILAGIQLTQAWYEGCPYDELEPEQILEGIQVAAKVAQQKRESTSTDWSGCCC